MFELPELESEEAQMPSESSPDAIVGGDLAARTNEEFHDYGIDTLGRRFGRGIYGNKNSPQQSSSR
jgi:hypothetical protein